MYPGVLIRALVARGPIEVRVMPYGGPKTESNVLTIPCVNISHCLQKGVCTHGMSTNTTCLNTIEMFVRNVQQTHEHRLRS